MKITLSFLILLFSVSLRAQPGISWQQCIGGTDGDEGGFVAATHDQGFIVAGLAASLDGNIVNNHGESDAYLIRYDANNNILWQKCYGGSLEDDFICVLETADHGFIAVGSADSNDGDVTGNHGDSDFWIVKVDSAGNILWQKAYGGTDYDQAFCIIENSAGHYIVSGLTFSNDGNVTLNHGDEDCWLIEIDAMGNMIWQKTYGGTDSDKAYQVMQTQDGGYIFSGFTYSDDGDVSLNHGEEDAWLVKTDASGNLQWQKTYGGSEPDLLTNVIQIANGHYVFASSAASYDGDVQNSIVGPDFWLVEVDGNGNIFNQHCLGGSDIDEPFRMIQTADGGYAVVGQTASNDVNVSGNHGYFDGWLLKLDANLNMQWQHCLGGTDEDLAYSVCQLSNDDYVVTGFAYSLDGEVTGNHGGGFQDIWTVRFSASAGVEDFENTVNFMMYPNPANSVITVQLPDAPVGGVPGILRITDGMGKVCLVKQVLTAKQTVDIENLSAGVYMVELIRGEKAFRKILMKD